MKSDPASPIILSASRTKDLVHRCPELLGKILLGEAPCRWGPHGPMGQVDPAALHTAVLWTKDPSNLLTNAGLRSALFTLKDKFGVQISLELTATGMGGSFMEPGIPRWRKVVDCTRELLEEGWIDPRAIIYRYDPFLSVRTPAGNVFSNANFDLYSKVCGEFLQLGIERVTTSRADAVHYPRVLERVQSLGLEWIPIDDEAAASFCRAMAEFCRSRGADFSICCDPPIPGLMRSWGCIDGRRLNQIKGHDYSPATEILHNKMGKQRPTCQCTYSRDIGYSPGSPTCYSGGFGCLYCYSQGKALLADVESMNREIVRFDTDPIGFWEEMMTQR